MKCFIQCTSPEPSWNPTLLFVCSIQAIRVFFMLRSLSLQLRGEPETQLPLTREEDLIKTDDVLDLSELPILFCPVGQGVQDTTLLIICSRGGSMHSMQSVLYATHPVERLVLDNRRSSENRPLIDRMRAALAFLVLWI